MAWWRGTRFWSRPVGSDPLCRLLRVAGLGLLCAPLGVRPGNELEHAEHRGSSASGRSVAFLAVNGRS